MFIILAAAAAAGAAAAGGSLVPAAATLAGAPDRPTEAPAPPAPDDSLALLQTVLSVQEQQQARQAQQPAGQAQPALAPQQQRTPQPRTQEQRPLQQRLQQIGEELATAGKLLELEKQQAASVPALGAAAAASVAAAGAGAGEAAAREAGRGEAGAAASRGGGVSLAAVHSAGSGDDVPTSKVRGILMLIFLIIFFVTMMVLFDRVHHRFSELKARSPDVPAEFSEFIKYRFQIWLSEGGDLSKAILIFITCVILLTVGTGVYCIGQGVVPSVGIFKIYKMIMNPSEGYNERTMFGRAIGVLMALGFLLILALLVAVVQDSVNNYLEHFRQGISGVIEVGHILLLGYTEDTGALIQELCIGYEPEGGVTIVLLAEEPKEEVEEKLRRSHLDMMNSNLVIRSGHPYSIDTLRGVSAETAATAILAPKRTTPREVRDSVILQGLLALAGKGWPTQGRILAVCSLARNRPLFETVGGPKCDIINVDDFMGKLMVQCSANPGTCQVMSSVFSFEGNEFYIKPVPKHLVGVPFGQAQFHFPGSILAGIVKVSNAERSLCPRGSTRLQAADDLVLLAEDTNHAVSTRKPCTVEKPDAAGRSPTHIKAKHGPVQKVETILILGWNIQVVGVLLFELDGMSAKGSKVLIMGPTPVSERNEFLERLQKRVNRKLANLTLQHVVGRLGSRHVLDELPTPVTKATRIFVLSDYTAETPAMADASTITMVLMVKDILQSTKEDRHMIPIVPEIRDRNSTDICDELRVHDLVLSSGTPAQILATIAHGPKLASVLYDLISEDGEVHFFIRQLSDYLPPGARVPCALCFWEGVHYVTAQGDILLGWSVPHRNQTTGDFDQRMAKLCGNRVEYEWEMNPKDKAALRNWDDKMDRLVVLAVNTGMAMDRSAF